MDQKLPGIPSFFCPYEACPAHSEQWLKENPGPKMGWIVRKGTYFRRNDSKWISRFRCLKCKRTFSTSRFTPSFRQKKRTLNSHILRLLASSVSQRRIARLLQINRKTVVRKFLHLACLAEQERKSELQLLIQAGQTFDRFQFDEMESFERSKCLPLSIPLIVIPGSRRVLSFGVASMPAKGLLASISRKKYGKRKDERAKVMGQVLSEISPLIGPKTEIRTDENPHYPGLLKRHLPQLKKHLTFKGRRGCVVGQGELKKIGRDPLFDLNHTAAMVRANVNRMVRRTWCTTKDPTRLKAHLEIYFQYHNTVLTQAA